MRRCESEEPDETDGQEAMTTEIVTKRIYVVGGETFDNYPEARLHAATLRQIALQDNMIAVLAASPFTDEAGAVEIARLIFERFEVKPRKS